MNIDYISDLHSWFYISKNKNIFWTDWFLKRNNKSNILIIAWDINEDINEMKLTFDEIINNCNYKNIIATFWNHDIRLYKGSDKEYWIKNSIDKYNFLINHFHWYRNIIHIIDKEDFIIEEEKIIIAWNMWWYNYTWVNETDKFFLERFYKVDFDKMSFAWFSSNDKTYTKFNDDIRWNIDFSEYLEKKLITRLENIRNNTKTKEYKILAISHLKPSRKLEKYSQYFITYSEDLWREIIKEWYRSKYNFNLGNLYWNAFYVNNNLHDIYKKYNIEYAIYGHTHEVNYEELEWIKYFTNSFGYYWNNIISKEIKTIKLN